MHGQADGQACTDTLAHFRPILFPTCGPALRALRASSHGRCSLQQVRRKTRALVLGRKHQRPLYGGFAIKFQFNCKYREYPVRFVEVQGCAPKTYFIHHHETLALIAIRNERTRIAAYTNSLNACRMMHTACHYSFLEVDM